MNLEKEIICGYEVSAQMKRIWAMELEIVEEFVRVCKENGLKYLIMGGTLLGAVRHKGFIPWDNDIDVIMPRADFDKLLSIGPESFKRPFFFQTPVTEESRFYSTSVRIRNENGTAATPEEFELGINCGMSIDVFCLDEIPDQPWKRKCYLRQLNVIAKMQRFVIGKQKKKGVINRIKHVILNLIYMIVYHSPDAATLFNLYQKKAGRYSGSGCLKVAHLAFGYHENFIWDKKDWDTPIKMTFEDMELNAPIGYDAILKHQYGDYMRIPDDKSTHDYVIYNPDVPYKKLFAS